MAGKRGTKHRGTARAAPSHNPPWGHPASPPSLHHWHSRHPTPPLPITALEVAVSCVPAEQIMGTSNPLPGRRTHAGALLGALGATPPQLTNPSQLPSMWTLPSSACSSGSNPHSQIINQANTLPLDQSSSSSSMMDAGATGVCPLGVVDDRVAAQLPWRARMSHVLSRSLDSSVLFARPSLTDSRAYPGSITQRSNVLSFVGGSANAIAVAAPREESVLRVQDAYRVHLLIASTPPHSAPRQHGDEGPSSYITAAATTTAASSSSSSSLSTFLSCAHDPSADFLVKRKQVGQVMVRWSHFVQLFRFIRCIVPRFAPNLTTRRSRVLSMDDVDGSYVLNNTFFSLPSTTHAADQQQQQRSEDGKTSHSPTRGRDARGDETALLAHSTPSAVSSSSSSHMTADTPARAGEARLWVEERNQEPLIDSRERELRRASMEAYLNEALRVSAVHCLHEFRSFIGYETFVHESRLRASPIQQQQHEKHIDHHHHHQKQQQQQQQHTETQSHSPRSHPSHSSTASSAASPSSVASETPQDDAMYTHSLVRPTNTGSVQVDPHRRTSDEAAVSPPAKESAAAVATLSHDSSFVHVQPQQQPQQSGTPPSPLRTHDACATDSPAAAAVTAPTTQATIDKASRPYAPPRERRLRRQLAETHAALTKCRAALTRCRRRLHVHSAAVCSVPNSSLHANATTTTTKTTATTTTPLRLLPCHRWTRLVPACADAAGCVGDTAIGADEVRWAGAVLYRVPMPRSRSDRVCGVQLDFFICKMRDDSLPRTGADTNDGSVWRERVVLRNAAGRRVVCLLLDPCALRAAVVEVPDMPERTPLCDSGGIDDPHAAWSHRAVATLQPRRWYRLGIQLHWPSRTYTLHLSYAPRKEQGKAESDAAAPQPSLCSAERWPMVSGQTEMTDGVSEVDVYPRTRLWVCYCNCYAAY